MVWTQLAALCAILPVISAIPTRRQATCNTTFNPISAQTWADGMNPGWNLGNTLDATPTEGSWNNPPVDFSTFDVVKKQGFRGIRLPITWTNHFTSDAPDYTIDPAWLDRVEAVVDAAIERDFYVLVNVHHDASAWADLTAAGADYTVIENKFYALWSQIATKLACKSERLSFETINEPPGSTVQQYQELTKLQDLFIKAVTLSGGFNTQRVLNLVGPSEDSALTSTYFVRPANISQPWLVHFHFYAPYPFIFGAWGETVWGSDADKAAIDSTFALVRGNFTDVPLVIGEWSASPSITETAARRKYNDFVVRTANKYNMTTVLWDNGADWLDRAATTWRDQTAVDIIIETEAGETNSLGDSTTDLQATTQESSAYIFQKVGDAVADQTLPFLFNSNTLQSIASDSGAGLAEGADYSTTDSGITFTSAFIGRTLGNATAGTAATLTLKFSAGADYTVGVVAWDQPILAETSSAASAVAAGGQLSIPIQWKGLPQLATVKAKTIEDGYLVDDFTQYFGPLADYRTTYSNQWSFDASNVILTSGAISAVNTAALTTTFTFEFYPRVPGNAVNYTLTV